MAREACPVCGYTQRSTSRYFKTYRVEFCSQCDHGITLPVISSEELNRLYDEQYFADQYEICLPQSAALQCKVREEDHRVRVLRQHIDKGRVLDVGCGLGFFLYACKEKYSPYGYDVSSSNKAYIEQQLGITLYTENEKQGFEEEAGTARFDAITFWHSLEHFQDPAAMLEYFISFLGDDGVLIIDVPVHDSIDAFKKADQWEGWQIPYHQHHFSSDSLRFFLNHIGLEIVSSHSYRSGYVYEQLRTKWYLKPFARAIAKLFPGGSMVVVCRRRGDLTGMEPMTGED